MMDQELMLETLRGAIERGDLEFLIDWEQQCAPGDAQRGTDNQDRIRLRQVYFGLNAETALHVAVSANHPELVAYLLESCDSDVNGEDAFGQTALFLSPSHEITLLLLSHGAKASLRRNDGRTALHALKDAASISLLLSQGADPNVTDRNGTYPLHCSCEPDSIEVLAQAGADLGSKDGMGHLPLSLASSKGKWKAVATLLRLGSPLDAVDDRGWTALQSTKLIKRTLWKEETQDREGKDLWSQKQSQRRMSRAGALDNRWEYNATIRYLELWGEELKSSSYSLSPLALSRLVSYRASWLPLKSVCKDPVVALTEASRLPKDVMEEIVCSYLGPFGNGPWKRERIVETEGQAKKLSFSRSTAVQLMAAGFGGLLAHVLATQSVPMARAA